MQNVVRTIYAKCGANLSGSNQICKMWCEPNMHIWFVPNGSHHILQMWCEPKMSKLVRTKYAKCGTNLIFTFWFAPFGSSHGTNHIELLWPLTAYNSTQSHYTVTLHIHIYCYNQWQATQSKTNNNQPPTPSCNRIDYIVHHQSNLLKTDQICFISPTNCLWNRFVTMINLIICHKKPTVFSYNICKSKKKINAHHRVKYNECINFWLNPLYILYKYCRKCSQFNVFVVWIECIWCISK